MTFCKDDNYKTMTTVIADFLLVTMILEGNLFRNLRTEIL